MPKNFVIILSILCINVGYIFHLSSGYNVNVSLQHPVTAALQPNDSITVQLTGIQQQYSFVVLQIHSHGGDIVGSLQPDPTVSSAVTGSHVGLLTLLHVGETTATWYIQPAENNTVDITFYVQAYTRNDPIPGGCNLEFNLEYDPNIHLLHTNDVTIVQFQHANIGFPRDPYLGPPSCEKLDFQSHLVYDVYLHYGSETSQDLLHLDGVITGTILGDTLNTHKLSVTYAGRTELKFARYPNINTYYTVIVRDTSLNTSRPASYVTTFTNGCDSTGPAWTTCDAQYSLAIQITCIITGVIGLFLCFFGHRFFKTELFVLGAAAFMLIAYILIHRYTNLDPVVCVSLAGVCGILGGSLWLLFWWFVGFPVLSVLLIGLLLGYLISSVVFNLTPFGDLYLWATDFNYGMAFTCGVLIVPVILLAFTKYLNIIACTMLGSYAVIVAVDIYIGSYISYIVLDSIRKAAIVDFVKAHTLPPFQMRDIILCICWLLLMISGLIFQICREKNRKPFPDCPRDVRKRLAAQRPRAINGSGGDNARTPLLAEQQAGSRSYGVDPGSRSHVPYGTVHDTSGFGDALQATERQIDRLDNQPT